MNSYARTPRDQMSVELSCSLPCRKKANKTDENRKKRIARAVAVQVKLGDSVPSRAGARPLPQSAHHRTRGNQQQSVNQSPRDKRKNDDTASPSQGWVSERRVFPHSALADTAETRTHVRCQFKEQGKSRACICVLHHGGDRQADRRQTPPRSSLEAGSPACRTACSAGSWARGRSTRNLQASGRPSILSADSRAKRRRTPQRSSSLFHDSVTDRRGRRGGRGEGREGGEVGYPGGQKS